MVVMAMRDAKDAMTGNTPSPKTFRWNLYQKGSPAWNPGKVKMCRRSWRKRKTGITKLRMWNKWYGHSGKKRHRHNVVMDAWRAQFSQEDHVRKRAENLVKKHAVARLNWRRANFRVCSQNMTPSISMRSRPATACPSLGAWVTAARQQAGHRRKVTQVNTLIL